MMMTTESSWSFALQLVVNDFISIKLGILFELI